MRMLPFMLVLEPTSGRSIPLYCSYIQYVHSVRSTEYSIFISPRIVIMHMGRCFDEGVLLAHDPVPSGIERLLLHTIRYTAPPLMTKLQTAAGTYCNLWSGSVPMATNYSAVHLRHTSAKHNQKILCFQNGYLWAGDGMETLLYSPTFVRPTTFSASPNLAEGEMCQLGEIRPGREFVVRRRVSDDGTSHNHRQVGDLLKGHGLIIELSEGQPRR